MGRTPYSDLIGVVFPDLCGQRAQLRRSAAIALHFAVGKVERTTSVHVDVSGGWPVVYVDPHGLAWECIRISMKWPGGRDGRDGLSHGGPELSDHDADVLASAGFVEDPVAATGAQLERVIRMQDLVHRSLTVEEAADRLEVTAARIRQRLPDGTLWVFGKGRNRLLPPAQFVASGEVPHLERIAPLLAKSLHPLTMQALLT